LRQSLANTNAMMRLESARALWRITQEAQPIIPTLVNLLANPDAHWQAALALGEMGPSAEAAIPALLEKLRNEIVHRPSRTPGSATIALTRMGAAAVPGLVELLNHPLLPVRVGAAMALQGQGTHASPAVPGLLRMLEETHGEARIVAAATLGAVGPPAEAALPRLLELAEQSDNYLRAAALAAVNRIQPTGQGGHALGPSSFELTHDDIELSR
jgi:HEAT repeat protein